MLNRSTVNKVILLGRISKTPRLQSAGSNQRMLCFPVVTTESVKRNGLTEIHQETHMVQVPEQLIDINKVTKDTIVYIQGRVQTTPYTDEHQVRHYRADIIANSVELMDIDALKNTVI